MTPSEFRIIKQDVQDTEFSLLHGFDLGLTLVKELNSTALNSDHLQLFFDPL